MESDWRVITAARVANTFSIDPMTVLDSSRKVWAIRVAAHNLVMNDKQKQSEANSKASKSHSRVAGRKR